MASIPYPLIRQALAQGDIAGGLDAVDVKAVLVDSGYTYSAAHQYLSDVGAATRVETSAAFSGKVFTNGTFDAADTPFSAVSGDDCVGVICYVDSGNEATSNLICFLELSTTYSPSGSDLLMVWHASGICTL